MIVFYVPEYIKTGLPLRRLWAYWNLLLSVFSIMGAYRTVPYLASHILEHGFTYTTCHDSQKWFLRHDEPNPCGFWVTLFIYSKIPELVDTVFLVFQKKPVIFLHWFHHVTVLLYCWHAFSNWTASGLWFVAMNFSVHSIMYFYYFLAISGYKGLSKVRVGGRDGVRSEELYTANLPPPGLPHDSPWPPSSPPFSSCR